MLFDTILSECAESDGTRNAGNDDTENSVKKEADLTFITQFMDAVELTLTSGVASTSLLQRKLSIGYGKAVKFIDLMEGLGIISKNNTQKHTYEAMLTLEKWKSLINKYGI